MTRLRPENGTGAAALAARSADLMLDKRASDILIMDLRGLTTMTDFFVLGSGESTVQVKAIVDHVSQTLDTEETSSYHIEGYEQLSWVLLDYVDVVAHVFVAEAREYYGLERLWADAKMSLVGEQSP
ncbi:MAG: ribosome silencing factor [Candidatus Neomarinimicrobiota bacterium]